MVSFCAAMVWTVLGQVDAATLLKEHEAQLRKIQSLQCTVEVRHSYDGGKTWKPIELVTVSRSGGRERVHQFHSAFPSGEGRYEELSRHIDASLSADGVLSMEGYDPEHPPREPWTVAEEMRTKHRLAGLIRPGQPAGPWGFKSGLAGDCYLLLLPDALNSLSDLIKATGNVKPVERRDGQGEVVWDLALRDPRWQVVSFVVTLSPRHGYAITQVERTVHKVDAPAMKKTTSVVEFQEPAPGIYIPRTIRGGDYSGNAQSILETIIRDVRVNRPVAEPDLAFRFPRGIAVGEMASTDGAGDGGVVRRFFLWGDGVPERTMTLEEYREWRRVQMAVKVPD